MPHEPYLVSMYRNPSKYFPNYKSALLHGGLDFDTKTFPAEVGEVLEIIWQNVVGNVPETRVLENHPFHAHGEHIWDAGGGSGHYSVEKLEELLKRRQPIKRDTTNLYRNTYPPQAGRPGETVSWRAWRLRVTTPGVWMLHCHILQVCKSGYFKIIILHCNVIGSKFLFVIECTFYFNAIEVYNNYL